MKKFFVLLICAIMSLTVFSHAEAIDLKKMAKKAKKEVEEKANKAAKTAEKAGKNINKTAKAAKKNAAQGLKEAQKGVANASNTVAKKANELTRTKSKDELLNDEIVKALNLDETSSQIQLKAIEDRIGSEKFEQAVRNVKVHDKKTGAKHELGEFIEPDADVALEGWKALHPSAGQAAEALAEEAKAPAGERKYKLAVQTEEDYPEAKKKAAAAAEDDSEETENTADETSAEDNK